MYIAIFGDEKITGRSFELKILKNQFIFMLLKIKT